ncbi:uncharacterized protein [Penaeus vannamei]|uniref:uncharacterized protein n=1 Tax=Penaeus vannamei TaxID=6689 RepID=UPI00387F45CE
MDWILGRATIQSHCGATLGNIKVTDLDFADDVAILSESSETLVVVLDAYSNEAKPLGLEVSWTKTKGQDFGDLIGEPVQSVHDIEGTESFTYLDGVVHNSGLPDQEALLMPVMLYGSETWTLSCALEAHLEAFSNRMIQPIRSSLFETTLSGGGLWDNLGSRVLGRSTKPVVKNSRWAESLPGV